MLQLMGNDTRTGYDGAAAVALAKAYQPDVILLDLGLPKSNGYAACRLIREQAGGHDVVLIAVTGWGQEKDRHRTRDAGFDHHFVKPVDPQHLMTMLGGLHAGQNKQVREQEQVQGPNRYETNFKQFSGNPQAITRSS